MLALCQTTVLRTVLIETMKSPRHLFHFYAYRMLAPNVREKHGLFQFSNKIVILNVHKYNEPLNCFL